MNNSAVRVLVMPPGEMSSRNNRGYYTKFAALPMTERFSCSVPGDARLNVTMGSAHSHSFPEHPQPYGKPCRAAESPGPDTRFTASKRSLLCKNTWSQPKAQDEGKYRCHAHIRHPRVQFLEQKRMRIC